MYTEHFGLTMLPFENVPDPKFFFDEGDHSRVRKRIADSLKAGRGLMVVTGPIGSGKTTLSQMIQTDISGELKLIWMALPPGNDMDLFMFLARELGLKPSSNEKVFIINEIRDALLKMNSEGSKCMMIIDESHMISDGVLDSIRILNNLEQGSKKLIQILLLGQDELTANINRPEMEPFKQRIATLEVIGKMSAERIRRYVMHRIGVAGGSADIFAETGWEALCRAFGPESTPRTINSFCDRVLSAAFEKEKEAVDVDDVYEVAQGMGLDKEVFHYRLEVLKREKEAPRAAVNNEAVRQEPPVEKTEAPPKGPETLVEENISARDAETADTEIKAPPIETGPPSPKASGAGHAASGIASQNLKMPLLVLLLSIVTFIMSLSSYCVTSGSSDIMTCLQEIFF